MSYCSRQCWICDKVYNLRWHGSNPDSDDIPGWHGAGGPTVYKEKHSF